MKRDAIIIRENDNVATALRDLRSGEEALAGVHEESRRVHIREDIAYGHKFAVRDIGPGEEILKYGEVIGRATATIPAGTHAHVHNVESLRGRGDLER